MDITLGFIADIIARGTTDEIANAIEYVWNSDKCNDHFA